MIVLGLHGWEGTHDAAAALVVDGQVVAMIEEERLNRRKHALSNTPRLAAHAVLNHAGIDWEDLDFISYGWDLPRYTTMRGRRWNFRSDREFIASALEIEPKRWPGIEWVGHHVAHAVAGFYSSGFERAAVLVVDGQGENKSVSLYAATRRGFSLIRDWSPSRSLGFMYEAATQYCGFGFLDAGKTMGLAAYGRPWNPLPLRWEDDDIQSPVPDGIDEADVVRAWSRIVSERFGHSRRRERVFDPSSSALREPDADVVLAHSPDVAAAAQAACEHVLEGLVDYAQRVTGYTNVVLAGGVALNCVANGKLAARCGAFFVPPAAHDAGAALGAALLTAHRAGDTVATCAAAYLGNEYSSATIESMLAATKIAYRRIDDPAAEAARRLLDGNVLGWFQGRGEVGPRALGRRSILALPMPDSNRQRVNAIKGREAWRPLAPSALLSETPWMFGAPIISPYMLQSLTLTDEARTRLGAIAHFDGSSRVQTVDAGETSPYARLLRNLRDTLGFGVVLNTSFNGSFEPLVATPLDAIRTFSTMGLDALLIGDFVLDKRA